MRDSAEGAEQVLIVGPAWIGDMVMTHSLCQVLRQQQSNCAIDLLAPGWSLPVVARMPGVRAGIEAPFGHGELNLSGRRALGRSLRQQGYSRAIVIPRSFKSALVPFFAAIPQRSGYSGEMRYGLLNDRRRLDKKALPRTVDRYVALARPADAPLVPIPNPQLTTDTANQQAALARLELSTRQRVVGLMPGAEYGPAKQWPIASFGELALQLARNDIATWIFGSEKDRTLGDAIVTHSRGASVNLCGRTSLADAIDLISLCSDVVSNDSGLMHVAAACGVSVIAIYGSSSPQFTPPLTEKHRVVWRQIDCSPCFDRQCRFGHYRCLREISAQHVLALIPQS